MRERTAGRAHGEVLGEYGYYEPIPPALDPALAIKAHGVVLKRLAEMIEVVKIVGNITTGPGRDFAQAALERYYAEIEAG